MGALIVPWLEVTWRGRADAEAKLAPAKARARVKRLEVKEIMVVV